MPARGTTPGPPFRGPAPRTPAALAAGAEVRAIRERLRKPDEVWEKNFAAYQADNELDMTKSPAEVLAYFRNVPAISKAYVVTRLLTLIGAVVWLVVFVLLAVAELVGLVWLADGEPRDPGLALFSVVVVALALAALIMAPAAYLLVPLLMPLDVVPAGLKKAVAPKLATEQGQGFLRMFLGEFEGAVNRAAKRFEAEVQAGAPANPGETPPGDGQPHGDAPPHGGA